MVIFMGDGADDIAIPTLVVIHGNSVMFTYVIYVCCLDVNLNQFDISFVKGDSPAFVSIYPVYR